MTRKCWHSVADTNFWHEPVVFCPQKKPESTWFNVEIFFHSLSLFVPLLSTLMMGSDCVERSEPHGNDKPEKRTEGRCKKCFRNTSHWSHEHEHHVICLIRTEKKSYLIFLYICLLTLNSEKWERVATSIFFLHKQTRQISKHENTQLELSNEMVFCLFPFSVALW